jgi:hypothetical protein
VSLRAKEKKRGKWLDLKNARLGRGSAVFAVGAVVEPTLIRGLLLSAGLAVIASAAVYVLAYFLFTIHEEIGISVDAALPIALWTFPVVFVGSLVGWSVREAHPGAR